MGEYFVSGGEQKLPLAGCVEIVPRNVFGSAQAPLIGIPLSDVLLKDASEDPFTGNVGGPPMVDTTPRMNGGGTPHANSSKDTGKTDDPKVPPSALLS